MKLAQELGAPPAARRLGLPRVFGVLRDRRVRLVPLPLFPVRHRLITPRLGPYATTFPPNMRLMPAHGCERPGYC